MLVVINRGGVNLRKGILLFFILVMMLTGCSNTEDQAKKVVDQYLQAVHDGDEVYRYLDVGLEGLIDVIDFEYLRALETEEIKDTREYDMDFYRRVLADEYDTFKEFREEQIDIHSDYEVLENSVDTLILWDGESYVDNHRFLYNVELVNAAGEKLYKKVEFYVEEDLVRDKIGDEFEEGYTIVDIHIR